MSPTRSTKMKAAGPNPRAERLDSIGHGWVELEPLREIRHHRATPLLLLPEMLRRGSVGCVKSVTCRHSPDA
ncbi:hypothetical protein GN956_G2671 [Arapaima gigas]